MDPNIRATLKTKVMTLLPELPEGFEKLARVNLDSLETEVSALPRRERLLVRRFSSLITELEALKMLSSELYQARTKELTALREGLFYQDLLPLMVFYEFWKDLDVGESPNLAIITKLLRDQRFNKIRNSIAHADFEFRGGTLVLNDRGYTQEFDFMKVTKLASCLSALVALMGA